MPLRSWQIESSENILNCILHNLSDANINYNKNGLLLIAPTRTGKSYAIADALKRAQDSGVFNRHPNKPCNILIVTKDTVVYQTSRVCTEYGLKNFFVTNYGSVRSKLGELWITWRHEWEYGHLAEKPLWNEDDKPDVVILDEVQEARNMSSMAAQIFKSYLESGGLIIASSATPFHTVDEARLVCMITGVVGYETNEWKEFSYSIASDPKAINHAAMKRLNDILEHENAITRFHDIKYLHRSINKCLLIDFDNPKQRAIYYKAYEEYLKKLDEAGRRGPKGIAAIWVATLKYRQCTELLRTPRLAKEIIARLNDDKQVIFGTNFVETSRAVWINLVRRHAIGENNISFVIGGQNKLARQKMVDRFQNGKSKILLFTLKSGGAGLSLHHDREESLPREVILPPTWSGIELVQALGRAHGPTSLSTTHQTIIWYKDTVEEEVAERVASRMTSMSEIVGKQESWTDMFMKRSYEEIRKKEQEEYNNEKELLNEMGPIEAYDGISNLNEPITTK